MRRSADWIQRYTFAYKLDLSSIVSGSINPRQAGFGPRVQQSRVGDATG